MARATSYLGVDGITLNPSSAADLYQAIDIVHSFAIEIQESLENRGRSNPDVNEILEALTEALERLEPLVEKNDWYDLD
jgi:DNA-binding NarL/FixJ family response regulator